MVNVEPVTKRPASLTDVATQKRSISHANAGSKAYGSRRFADAVAPLREAAKRAPDEALVQYNLGKALSSSGRREEAEQPLRAALRGNPPEDVRKEVEALLAGK